MPLSELLVPFAPLVRLAPLVFMAQLANRFLPATVRQGLVAIHELALSSYHFD